VDKAEVFVLIIMGSIPTLRPLLSLIRGHMPCVSDYASSQQRTPKDSKITTVGSKSSNRFSRRGHGDATIALNDIDNMSRQHAGSSTESILVESREKTKLTATASQASESPRISLPPPPAVGTPVSMAGDSPSSFQKNGSVRVMSPDQAIQAQRDFTISYGERSVQDDTRLEWSKRL
jgi:hypothetical protein